jgi:hypothetical protein
MYNTFVGKIGFNIRKSDIKCRVDKTISLKLIVCSQGSGNTKVTCNAHIQFSISREGTWIVQKIVPNHNHYLVSPHNTCKPRSQRHVIEMDRVLITQIREVGMKLVQVYEFMKLFYGGVENIPFSMTDCNNEIGSEQNKYLESNDAQTLLVYLKNM